MPKQSCFMAPNEWPGAIRSSFEEVFANASIHRRPRLERGLGIWLFEAQKDELPPGLISPSLLERRLGHLQPDLRASARQALQAIFPDTNPFQRELKVDVESELEALQRKIGRNWHRLPPVWQAATAPKLYVCPEDLSNGHFFECWALATIEGVLETAWRFFDFCREHELSEEVSSNNLKLYLDHRQKLYQSGLGSLSTTLKQLQRLKMLGVALFPERKWDWFNPAIAYLKKMSALQPSRNNARLVDLDELRRAALSCGDVALKHHHSHKSFVERVMANKLARTGLAISILVNSPIRLKSLSKLDLKENFDANFTRMYLSPKETKDKKRDERILSREVQKQLRDYIENHRATVAPLQETALFVGRQGKPIGRDYLSQTIGDLCEKLFNKRVTPQVMRNIIASFIVSHAPEKAGLATVVLNHSSSATTEGYRFSALQIKAADKLLAACDQGRAEHGVKAVGSDCPTEGKKRKRRAYMVGKRHSRSA